MAYRYYRGQQARHYNQRWQTYTGKTLAEAIFMIDFTGLNQGQQSPRVLDVACGTGTLMRLLLERDPSLEMYGIDGSEDMLTQARVALKHWPEVFLEQADLNQHGWAQTLSTSQTFNLITATNVLHDITDLPGFLTALKELLTSEGQLILEDFTSRRPLWLWKIFESVLQRVETAPVRALSLSEIQTCCEQAGLRVLAQKTFVIDWFWHGWTLRASRKG